MTKKEYPSQARYRQNHPAITFRLKKDDKERLDTIIKATGKSLARYMTDFIQNDLDHEEEMSELAIMNNTFKEWGFELEAKYKELEMKIKDLKNEEKFILPCSICGKPMTISSKNANWQTEISPKLKDLFGKRYHIKCKSSNSPSSINTINSKEDSNAQYSP
ncbi:hypothetical protein [Methanoregula sp.]|jgi:predicted DNA-binding protein|uniref:hypothetical protein n=1 Tax=Methanoregula sp. TaxID=2052170 RepID=UPI003C1E0D36